MRSLSVLLVGFVCLLSTHGTAEARRKKKKKAKPPPAETETAPPEPAPPPDEPEPAPEPVRVEPTATAPGSGPAPTPAPAPAEPEATSDAVDVDSLRQEYLKLRDELFESRARAATVASALYSTRIQVKLAFTTGRFYGVSRATVRLDGASV
jgi:outer membrane biosynthesis protein TonB